MDTVTRILIVLNTINAVALCLLALLFGRLFSLRCDVLKDATERLDSMTRLLHRAVHLVTGDAHCEPTEPPAPGQCPECRGDGYLYREHGFYQCQNGRCNHSWHAAPAEEAVATEWGIPELNTERRTANGHTYAEFSTLDPKVQAKVDEILGGDGGR